jgi:hypothetical protein
MSAELEIGKNQSLAANFGNLPLQLVDFGLQGFIYI